MNIFIMVKIVYMTTIYNVQILKLSFLLTVELGSKILPINPSFACTALPWLTADPLQSFLKYS